MLLKPKRLPQRFSRRVNPKTRAFVKKRNSRRSERKREQWRRSFRRMQRKIQETMIVARRWTVVIICSLVGLGVCLVLFSPLLEVREIRVSRSDPRLDIEGIQRSLAPIFHRHMVFLSRSDIQDLLVEAVPDMEDLTVDKDYPDALRIRVMLDPIVAKLQIEGIEQLKMETQTGAALAGSGAVEGEQPVLQPTVTYHYLTKKGIYTTLSLALSGTVLPTIRVVDWGGKPSPGMTLIAPDVLKRMQETENALRNQFGAETQARTVFLRAREFHLKTKTYSLWFDLRSSLPEQLLRYRTFLKAVQPGEVKEYVDLRLAGRVVYK